MQPVWLVYARAMNEHMENAHALYAAYKKNFIKNNGYFERFKAPKGYSFVGDGASRVVYRKRGGDFVYKLGYSYENLAEAAAYRRLSRKSTKNLPFKLAFPYTRNFYVDSFDNMKIYVAAQQFIKGKETNCSLDYNGRGQPYPCNCNNDPCFSHVREAISDFTNIFDMHGGNVLIDKNKTFWVIDMAEYDT